MCFTHCTSQCDSSLVCCRQHERNISCTKRITGGSGYCECSDRWSVNRCPTLLQRSMHVTSVPNPKVCVPNCRVGCEKRPAFTCAQACAQLNEDISDGLKLPYNVTCPVQGLLSPCLQLLIYSRAAPGALQQLERHCLCHIAADFSHVCCRSCQH